MLHIILLILKIIGIILAAILGILVLLLCIVLFVPLRYEIQGECKGTLESLNIHVKFSWLLHLISGYVRYHNQEVEWQMRAAFKKFPAKPQKEPASEVGEELGHELEAASLDMEDLAEEEEDDGEEIREITWGDEEDTTEADDEQFLLETTKKPAGRFQIMINKVKALFEKIKVFFRNIKYTFRKICDNIKVLLKKKELLTKFVTYEAHQRAVKKALKELKRLLSFLKPKKIQANIHFGFEDPYLTGQVLAGLSIAYPFIGEHTSILPDFEQQVLEGDIYIKGKVRAIYLVIVAWNLFWNKDVRITYKHIKNLKLRGK